MRGDRGADHAGDLAECPGKAAKIGLLWDWRPTPICESVGREDLHFPGVARMMLVARLRGKTTMGFKIKLLLGIVTALAMLGLTFLVARGSGAGAVGRVGKAV